MFTTTTTTATNAIQLVEKWIDWAVEGMAADDANDLYRWYAPVGEYMHYVQDLWARRVINTDTRDRLQGDLLTIRQLAR